MRENLHRIEVKGGVLSPLDFKRILEYALDLELEYLHLGSRQDILFPDKNKNGVLLRDSDHFNTSFFVSKKYHNICCSYVSTDIFNTTPWVRGTTFLYILEEFSYQPSLRINIIDPVQQIVPFFTGNLNFIASDKEDFWYLYLDIAGWDKGFYPVLIYTWDIVKISSLIEEVYGKIDSIDELFSFLNEHLDTNNSTIDKPLISSSKPFPYYEGMNKMGQNQYWVGLYWRNNKYDIEFLYALCNFCIENKVGKICLTPWKSFIIKGILKEDKLELEKLLGSRGINIRHSSLELNWHIPVNDEEALGLKKHLVSDFDKRDISTYGLTFGIYGADEVNTYFTTIVIEKTKNSSDLDDVDTRNSYNIKYADSFNPGLRNYKVFAQDVSRNMLPDLLVELTKVYFDNLGKQIMTLKGKQKCKDKEVVKFYQCTNCLNVYDEQIGDVLQDISPQTSFKALPDSYCCAVCDAPKSQFESSQLPVTNLQ